MHEHYDTDDNLTGYTVITRESMWDDESRGRALRLAEYEAGLCPCGCGLPAAQAHETGAGFLVHDFTCKARMAIEQQRRKDEAAAKANKLPTGWNDGLNYYASPPDET